MEQNGGKQGRSPFEGADSLKLSFNHLKIWYTAGMGFFTDAYDLFNITAILIIFGAYSIPGFIIEHNTFVTGALASSSIISAVIGQLIFGFLGDRVGRKAVYGVEASLMVLGAVLSALSPNIYYLIAFRSIMGLGIGGDYPISATIMSEYSNTKDRGKLIALVFANQGLGTLAAIAVGVGSVIAFPASIAWRVIAGVGAIPAATVIYLRRKTPETPRYALLVKGDAEEAKKAATVLGTQLQSSAVRARKVSLTEFLSKYGFLLVGTASTWFILDMALYGTGAYSGVIVSSILGTASTLEKAILYAGIPYIIGFFGYFTAVAAMDRLGRKVIQTQGFLMMAILYAAVVSLALTSGSKITGFLVPSWAAMLIYGLSYFFIDFGPNTTTFVIPAEVFPVRYRTTGHGISAAAGKLGAAITTFIFPELLLSIGVKGILEMLAIVSVIGAILTVILVKEPKLKNLEEASKEELEIATRS
ncbi:MFS transporter [Sulfodiicoccus acidiphilus]|uniref:MFS transporter n=1 Tax=Sulfodiicoccus acidiphilus TaxID=1670455 RepID=A0A348B0R7_9CREN|nr:MFS transporter [Sulfodiicoccus acidiphilus]BBD71769.1 MFS transporter [Sulfodiicoccus acidiphilus]GGT99106.1 MFS transporter [Sulfodiicoccus acidiphilus]